MGKIKTGSFAKFKEGQGYNSGCVVIVLGRRGNQCDYFRCIGQQAWGTCNRSSLVPINKKEDEPIVAQHYESLRKELVLFEKAFKLME